MAKKKSKSKSTKAAISIKPAPVSEVNKSDTIPALLNTLNQPVLMKVCRLCESKDGPFLNIFDADKMTAKKIDQLLPFVVAENDDLPHKICFRCSAKVEELYEFVQRCVNTQESLHNAVGKKGPVPLKAKPRKLWEEKLNKSNMTNDDICDALIKKAMEGIKDIPLNPLPIEDKRMALVHPAIVSKETKDQNLEKDKSEELDSIPLKQIKDEQNERKIMPIRSSRSKIENVPEVPDEPEEKITRSKRTARSLDSVSNKKSLNNIEIISTPPKVTKLNNKPNGDIAPGDNNVKENLKVNSNVEETKPKIVKEDPKPFNIMDHVCMIKVNGVGVLFQCKLCNRNFLKEEVVMSHGCAKNGGPRLTEKVDLTKNVSPPEVPKAPTVKYITTKVDNDKKPIVPTVQSLPATAAPVASVVPKAKTKPKIGPASKVRRDPDESGSNFKTNETPVVPSPPNTSNLVPPLSSVQFPGAPSLKSRYKLIPGPNNTFTLVEDATVNESSENMDIKTSPEVGTKVKERKTKTSDKNKNLRKESPDVIDLEDHQNSTDSKQQPYPVGLFQTVPHHSGVFPPPSTPQAAVFTTPAMKKQSYTIVQTGNPSKLLISTKPQPPPEDPPKKRQKKKQELKDAAPEAKQPFSVTLEDAAPPKDAGFFTFINVDPLLQPSYVLPTDTIIQESQISTSTPVVKSGVETKEKDKYSCNMCGEKFSREKKMLAHIQSHYAQMDEEDQVRTEKTTRKRGRKT